MSPIEDDFAEFCGQRGMPLGEANVPIVAGARTRIVDRLYREARLAVELDGRDDTHASWRSRTTVSAIAP
jgi:hypothetical protein